MHINCFDKLLKFLESEESTGSSFMTASQVWMSLRESAQVFMVSASLRGGSKRMITDLPVVCEFPKVFPDDINDLLQEREVEFTIYLVPSTSLVSMTPYRISVSELSELKKQLEDLLEKKFIQPSVSPWEASTLLS